MIGLIVLGMLYVIWSMFSIKQLVKCKFNFVETTTYSVVWIASTIGVILAFCVIDIANYFHEKDIKEYSEYLKSIEKEINR